MGDNDNKVVDLSWARMPGLHKFNRRKHKKEWVTLYPRILRDLSTFASSSFNPNEVWEREQEKDKEIQENLQEPKQEKGKKSKKVELSKVEVIEAQNRQRKADIALGKDIERIRNKKVEGGLLSIIRDITTPKGRMVLYVEILALAIMNNDKKLAYDVFWAIELTEFYIQKQLDFDIPKPETKKYPSLTYDTKANIKRCIDKVLEWRVEEDMIVKQLTDMSDCLPPLTKFDTGFRLDPWQKRVLRWIDNNKSVIICAPTSSGKTVLSTYVSFMGRARALITNKETKAAAAPVAADEDEEDSDEEGETLAYDKDSIQRVLFIVPTEPLAWQVCAHFTRLFRDNGYHTTSVAVVTNQLTYSPNRNLKEPPLVVVGTPCALESALVKVRGKVTWAEQPISEGGDGLAKTTLPGGTHHYKWVVYDEVHILNGEEGEALQRIIKMMNCNFLALSATVGNAEQLRGWFEQVRGQQMNVEVVSAPMEAWANTANPESLEDSRLVKLQQHSGRFINLQRHVWNVTPGTQELDIQPLHPLAAVESVSQLQRGIFSYTSLPMTPADSYRLWDRLANSKTETGEPLFPAEAIADADPHNFFGPDERITLQRTKDYEDYLKQVLQDLANEFPERTQTLLEGFHISDPPLQFDLCQLILNLRERQMLPALVFHLNVFDLIKLFKQLLGGLEYRQKNKYPTYYNSLLSKQKLADAELESAFAGMKTDKEKEEAMRFSDMPTEKQAIDLTQPHPEFLLARKQLTEKEFNDICDEIKREDKLEGVVSQNALLRGLRRGIGLYIDEPTFPAYRRTVMRLANKGALAVVLSDSSLAFGVNMPFRTGVFAGEMGGLLDPLMAQQMSGRAGRRGLDEQGHIVFAAAHASFIRNIMIGQVPAITGGKSPRSETQFVLSMNSWYLNGKTFPHQLDVLDGVTLDEHCSSKTVVGFNGTCRNIMESLGIIKKCGVIAQDALEILKEQKDLELDFISFYGNRLGDRGTPSGYCPNNENGISQAVLWVMWELRDDPAESFALGRLLPYIFEEFVENNKRLYALNEKLPDSSVIAFFATILHIIDRHPCREGQVPMHQHPFILQNPASWEEWEDRLQRYNQRLTAIPNAAHLQLPVPLGEPLDSTVFDVFYNNRFDRIPSEMKQEVKKRVWHIGNVLRILHNCTYPDSEKYLRLELITRTCFQRLLYLTREIIQAEINFREVCSHEYETRNDTGIEPTPEVVLWGDAGLEPVFLDPFSNSSTINVPIKKSIRVRSGLKDANAVATDNTVSDEGGETKTASNPSVSPDAQKPQPAASELSTAAVASSQLAEAIKEAKKMKPNDLKDALKTRKLSIQGNKNDLLNRLLDAIKQEHGDK